MALSMRWAHTSHTAHSHLRNGRAGGSARGALEVTVHKTHTHARTNIIRGTSRVAALQAEIEILYCKILPTLVLFTAHRDLEVLHHGLHAPDVGMVQAHAVLNRRSQARLERLGPKVVLHALGQGRLAGEDLPEPRTDVALRDLASVIELHVHVHVHVAEVGNGEVSESR